MPLRPLVLAAAPAGLIASLLLTAVQAIGITPLIRAAEAFESAGHGHAPSLWATAAANCVIATAFALAVAAGMSLHGRAGWRHGVAWGVAGYAVFFVAPSLGLAPTLPGAEEAPLHARQLWWVGTVTASALGLALLVFARHSAWRAAGAAIIVVPHLVGAPQVAPGGSVPPELASAFVRAAFIANAALWLSLGPLAGYFLSSSQSGQRLSAAPGNARPQTGPR